ncbi:MAG: hypothetical protein ACFB0C_13835 [Leptolyngbyaceae cyanobacterium]
MSTLRQRAINGEVAALNDLIYAQLEGRGLLVTVQKDAANCLTIRLQGETVPDPAVYQDYIIGGLQQLRPLDVQSIRVVGEAFDPATSPAMPWEVHVPVAKPRRSLRHQLQNPRPSELSGQGLAQSSAGRRTDGERSQSLRQFSPRAPQARRSPRQTRPLRASDRAAPNHSHTSPLSTARQTVSKLVPAPSGPPGAWLPMWLEWFLVTGVLTLCWGLGISRLVGGNVFMAALVVYLQTCVVARRLPEARAWLTVSSLTTLLVTVLLPLFGPIPGVRLIQEVGQSWVLLMPWAGPIPGVGLIQGDGQSWVSRKTAKEPLSWAIFHGLLIVAAYIISLAIEAYSLPFVWVGYVLTSTALIGRCLGTLPEQLPVPPMGIAAYGQAFLRRPWQSAEWTEGDPPTNTGSTTYTVAALRGMTSKALGQNLWAIWLLASAALTGLSLWLFIAFIDHFAGLNLYVWFVIFAQFGLIVVSLVLYVLIVLVSSPPRAVGWQVPGLILLGISLLQLWVISSVIVSGSG